MSRAIRRHHKDRMRARARRVAGWLWGRGAAREQAIEDAVRNCDNLKACSCSMCCNPRRSGCSPAGGKTVKEIQAEWDLRDEVSTEGAR